MAEFKLGRIRFVWKDEWTTATTYYVDDVVRNGGKTYICQVGHTASPDFYTDLEYSPTKWNQMSDGQEWKGDWTVATFYKENDIVKYGGLVYICNNSHTSAATTTLGLEDNQSDWDEFNAGLEYKGAWSGSSVVYKVNDVVKQGAGLWICTTQHTSTASFITDSATYWSQFVEGIEFENQWSSLTTYQPGDVVRYGGNQYIAKTNHLNEVPSTSTDNWDLFQEGFAFSSDWNSGTSYRVGNIVRLRGYTYLATADSLNQEPPNITYWQKLNSGIAWQGEWVDDVEYKLGDAVRYGSNAYICVLGHRAEGDDGSSLGGADLSRPDQDVTGTYWNLLSIGTETSILSTRGDLVYYGGSGPTRLPVGLEGQVLRAGTEDPEWVTLGATDQLYFVAPHGTDSPAPIHGKSWDKPFKTIRYACEQVEKGPRYPNAQRLLELNRVFIQREVTSWIDYQIANAGVGSIWENFDYDEHKCERDTGFLVDRIMWDIGHGGNLKMRAAAQTYLNLLSEGPFSNEDENNGTGAYARLTEEADNDIQAFEYMLEVVEAVLANEAPTVVYQNVTDDSSAIAEQFIDPDVVAEAGVLTEITSLVTIVTDALANPTQDESLPTIPERYVPFSLVRVATGRYRETLPIIVPAYTCVQGDELRSTNAGPAGSLVDIADSYYTINTFDRVSEVISNVVQGIAVTPTTGNSETQNLDWPAASELEATAVTQLVNVMKLQSDYRLGTMHTSRLTDPVGYNVEYLIGYGNARALVKDNKKFLQEEVISYLEETYSYLEFTGSISGDILTVATVETGTVTPSSVIRGSGVATGTTIDQQLTGTTGGAGTYQVSISQTTPSTVIKADTKYGRTDTRRDAGYLVDAIVYDLTYGGNSQSVTAGLAYFDGDNADSTVARAQIPASIKSATLGAIEFLKTRMQSIATGASFTPLQTAIPRVAGAAGSAGAATLIGNNMDDIIEIIDTGPGAVGVTVTLADPATTDGVSSTTALIAAYAALDAAASTIRSNTISYINAQYPTLVYDSAKCSRDVGTILKAVGYDFMLGNTATINEFTNFKSIIAAQSYLRANATEVYTLGQKAVTIDAIEYARTQAIANVGADTTAIARINVLMTLIKDIIYSATNEGQVCSTEVRNRDYAILQLERNRAFIVEEIRAWINYNYVNFDDYYDSDTCNRDIGLIIEAVISDLATGSNFASSVAGSSYYRIQSALVPSSQMMQTVAAMREAKRLTATYITDDSLYSDITLAFDNVIAILQGGLDAVPTYVWPDNGTSDATSVADAAALQTNRATMITGVETYLSTTSPYDTVWAGLTLAQQNACKRDVGYIIDAITYDVQYGGNYQSNVAGSAYYSFGTLQIAGGEKAASIAAVTQLGTLMKAYTSSTGDTAVDTLTDLIEGIINTGTIPAYTLPSVAGESAAKQATHAAILAGSETVQDAVTAYITDTFSSYTYNQALCLRDVGTYIDALKWDLKYTSNYKSRFVARYYANAVLGSLEEDMYYLRDGTGLRDQSLEGLSGDLTPENTYGTSRVTAGAYASLDPGWGPDDFRTWIISRSPYIQGVTTFGNGAIGQKIDGALHNGGNDSMVSNDFTQVISDGIGAWVANNGRAELVSVFTYYSHIGYLSTEGGRIRGTNGNNSYGDFGSVAEGFDDRETPNTGVVDNVFQFSATIGNATTDGGFVALEFDNAGIDYTEAEFTLSGGGLGATSEADEFRDGAVYQVRLLQLAEDGIDGEFGGQGYVTNSNTAQGGTTTQITLAATDSELSTAYPGMKVVINGGTGVGQFAIIDTYNSGTKVATVVKESTGDAGWDHFVAGSTIAAPDASSTYTVEPRITFSAPSYSSAPGSTPAAGTYSDIKFAKEVVTYFAVASTGGSGTGATFNVIKNGTKYIVTWNSGGTGYERLDVLTIAGTSLGGADTLNDITITVTSINSVNGEVVDFDHTGYGVGGNFVALLSGSATAVTSIGGTWTSRTLSASRDWIAAASGQDLTSIAAADLVPATAYKITSLSDSLFNVVGAETNFVGTTFIATGPTTGAGTVVAINSVMVAIATGSNTTTRSVDGGITWEAGGNLPSSTTWTSIAYGRGTWVAVASGGTANAYSTDGGQTWTAGGALPASATWTSVAYGGGKFVAVASGGTQAAYSTNEGETWTTATLPSSTNWKSVAFGNNRFVAVSSTSGTAAAYSLNGIDWEASTIISAAYQSVTYGQGSFLAVGASTTAASSVDGVVWTSRTISTSDSASVAFGNTNRTGKFVTISNTGSSNVSVVNVGTQARARASVANGKIFAIRIQEPGSGYAVAPTMTITDPNNTFEAPFTVRIGSGVLGNPSFVDRGSAYETASAEIFSGDGFADNYQPGSFVAVRRLESRPVPGSNVVFSNLPDRTFKLVNVITFRGQNDGSYTGFLQVSPTLTISEAPENGVGASMRLRYSQVRLTGHDFLDIGTGSFIDSNYPGEPVNEPIPANETVDSNGGRVFFTATDQDGNFRVGDLFAIEQSTGIATLNADAFNISGLQELNLGNVTLGGGSATVTEFSTDQFFTADSDNIVPTQRAIKAFIASQIGGGGASLNVNSVTAGSIFISSNVITTVTNTPIKMDATFEFRGGVLGIPLALNFFF